MPMSAKGALGVLESGVGGDAVGAGNRVLLANSLRVFGVDPVAHGKRLRAVGFGLREAGRVAYVELSCPAPGVHPR